MPLALLALTISAFAIGTTEFVIVGLVPTIARTTGCFCPVGGVIGFNLCIGGSYWCSGADCINRANPSKITIDWSHGFVHVR